MRWLCVVALVGCAAPESAAPTRGSAASGPVSVPGDAGVAVAPGDAVVPLTWTISATSVLTPAPATGAVVASNHGGAISMLAVSEDGNVATTSDGRSVRLWPSLDGKREPVVVAMRSPMMLAVVRDGDAVVIAGVDAIGQLELVRTSGEGAPLARLEISSARSLRTASVRTCWRAVGASSPRSPPVGP